ncbi:MAG: hypothetical protein ACKVHR_15530 [Pirellulales bacterium]|jgi:hypothetical protein
MDDFVSGSLKRFYGGLYLLGNSSEYSIGIAVIVGFIWVWQGSFMTNE